MTKDCKGSATIRRRKLRHHQGDLEKARSSVHTSPVATDDEDHEVDEEEEGYLFDEEVLGTSVVKRIMSSEKTLFLGLIAFRVLNALLIQTHFVPDEYWQSLEVAHNMVFGYGYLTWEWQHGLRGYLYPSIFAVLYKVLAIFGLDSRILLIKLPRILQGIIAAYGDLYLFKLSSKLTDRATAQWTLLCQILSWFMIYCSTRTLTNSMETVFITAALFYYPWPGKKGSSTTKFLTFVSLSILVRPTAAVIWILMCSWHLQQNNHIIYKIIKQYIIIGLSAFVISLLLDSGFYGNWVFVQYNFLKFNFIQGGGSFYGTHPWHWYLTQGYPVIMFTHLYPFVMGVWKAKNKVLVFLIAWTVIIYSFLSHKEFRFIMPVLPLSMHYCGVYFQALSKKPRIKKKKIKTINRKSDDKETLSNSSSSQSLESSVDSTESSSVCTTKEIPVLGVLEETSQEVDGSTEKIDSVCENEDPVVNQQKKHKWNLTKAKILVIILIVTNIPVALYFCLIHQRGTIVVMKYLYDQSVEQNTNVLFLMPCHSTPYYSYIHNDIYMRFLTCEPNLNNTEGYQDEAEVFYEDPTSWLKAEFHVKKKMLPTHVVYFNVLQPEIDEFLSQNGYKHCNSFFHTHIPEGRVGSQVFVSCR